MIQYLANRDSLLHISIQHQPYQINTLLAHYPRHAQIMIHDFVNRVEGVLLVDNSVEQDSKGPDVLFFAAVGFAGEDFGGGII